MKWIILFYQIIVALPEGEIVFSGLDLGSKFIKTELMNSDTFYSKNECLSSKTNSNINIKESLLENGHPQQTSSDSIEKVEELENIGLTMAVKTSEFKTIMSAIQTTSSRTAAAKKLGISPRTLRYKIAQLKNLGIPELSFD